jgi:FtsP/CotA-like multicopper oxidase with cupredoxin domain
MHRRSRRHARSNRPPTAGLEDYQRAAGRRVGDTLVVALDIQEVSWRPEGPAGAELTVFTFAERGGVPRVPGPMIRVPAGTVVRATFRNTLDSPVSVLGLQDHPANALYDTVLVAPGAEQTVSFRTTAPGTYYYFGRVRKPGVAPAPSDQVAGWNGAETAGRRARCRPRGRGTAA